MGRLGILASAFRELTEEINLLEGLFDGRLAIGLQGADLVHVLFEAARACARAVPASSFPVFAKIAISFAGMGHLEAALEAIREIRDSRAKEKAKADAATALARTQAIDEGFG